MPATAYQDRLSKNHFKLPDGEIVSAKVCYVLVRYNRENTEVKPKCDLWELVLPEITYRPRKRS